MKFNLCKKIFAIVFICFFQAAYTETLLVQKTKYFDIIYAKSSETSAALIAEYADNYAEEICTRLGKRLFKKIPVYIAPNKEELNGYYTFIPYERIVLFDAVPDEGQLGGLRDVILKVFYHELTHAITFRHFLPVLPLSFLEGVAVLFESSDGTQGRLNDPLVYHHLMQGRIEGKTPGWKQAAGHRDVYPAAFWAYIYGASFADYLQKTYGMDVYAKYWHSSFFIFPKSKTKKIFNKTLDSLWNSYIHSIYYPQKVIKPEHIFSKQNKSGFNVMTSAAGKTACFDFAKKEVFLFDITGKKQKLFNSNPTVSSLNFSHDGNLMLVGDLIQTLNNEKNRTVIFDLKSNSFLKNELLSVKHAAFCGGNVICGIKVKNQFTELTLFDLNTFTQIEVLFTAGPGKPYSAIYNPVFAGKNQIAFIAANGIDRDILIIDTETKKIKKLNFEKKLPAIRYLQSNNSYQNPVLTFSWAEKNMLYRLGVYDIKTETVKILEEDISGGVFFPVIIQSENKNNIKEFAYAGLHAKHNSLYKLSETKLTEYASSLSDINSGTASNKGIVSGNTEKHTIVDYTQSAHKTSIQPDTPILNGKKYNYFSYLWRALPLVYFIPPADLKNKNETGLAFKLLGLDASTLIKYEYDSIIYFKPFFYNTNFNLKINSSPADCTLNFYDLNAGFKYRKLGFSVSSNLTIPTKLTYQNFTINAGLAIDGFSFFPANYSEAKTLYVYPISNSVLSEEIAGTYSYIKNIQRLDTDFFAKHSYGVGLKAGIKHGIHLQSKSNAFTGQIAATAAAPVVPLKLSIAGYAAYNAFLSPTDGQYRFFGNTPFIGLGSYCPAMSEYQNIEEKKLIPTGKINLGFSTDTEITVLSYEIQRANFLIAAIFVNRLIVTAGYRNIFNFLEIQNKFKLNLYQSFYTRAYFSLNGMAILGFEYAQPIEKAKLGKFNLIFNINF